MAPSAGTGGERAPSPHRSHRCCSSGEERSPSPHRLPYFGVGGGRLCELGPYAPTVLGSCDILSLWTQQENAEAAQAVRSINQRYKY